MKREFLKWSSKKWDIKFIGKERRERRYIGESEEIEAMFEVEE